MLRTIHDPDRGAGLAEYAAVIVLVAAVLAGLVAVGLPARIQDGVSTAADDLFGRGGTHDPRTTSADSGDRSMRVDPDTTAEFDPDPSSPGSGGANPEWWDNSGTWGSPSDKMPLFGFQDRGGYNWDCGRVLDGVCKVGGGLYKGARDITDPMVDAACLIHVCSHSGFKNNWKTAAGSVKKVVTQNPVTTVKELWGGFKEPFDEAAKEGGGFKNIAYAVPSAIGSVVSFKGITKAFKKDKKPEKPRKSKKESNGHEPGSGMGDAPVPPYESIPWAKKRFPIPDNLTKAQKQSVRYYTGGAGPNGGYININRKLRGQEPLDEQTARDREWTDRAVKDIDAALKRNRLKEPAIVYRGVGGDFLERLGVDPSDPAAVEGLTGRTLREKGYVSTSFSDVQANAAVDRGDVRMRIRVPQGHGAMHLGDYELSPYAYEQELLVDRNSRYVVHDAYVDDRGRVAMDVEIVPEGWEKPGDWAPSPMER